MRKLLAAVILVALIGIATKNDTDTGDSAGGDSTAVACEELERHRDWAPDAANPEQVKDEAREKAHSFRDAVQSTEDNQVKRILEKVTKGFVEIGKMRVEKLQEMAETGERISQDLKELESRCR